MATEETGVRRRPGRREGSEVDGVTAMDGEFAGGTADAGELGGPGRSQPVRPARIIVARGRRVEAAGAGARSHRSEAASDGAPTTEDFAAMLGGAPMETRRFEVGEKLRATVVSIGDGVVFVSLGGKSEGVLDATEFRNSEDAIDVELGDEIEAWVVSIGSDGVRLSGSLGRDSQGGELLEQASAAGIPVDGKVTGVNKGGFDVEVMGRRAFCPLSQISVEPVGDPQAHVGQSYRFRIMRIEEGGRNLVVSRSALIRQEREIRAKETLGRLEPGAILDGVVTRIEDFGAFVDIGGMDGMVHVSEIGWSRVAKPSEVLHLGEPVRVKVLRIENAEDAKQRRIALSMKDLLEDPWIAATSRLQPGDTTRGRVVRIERFGAFVELLPGVDGLVHVSELSHGKRVTNPEQVVAVGDEIDVQVLDVDPRKRQIALSMKALAQDPWQSAVAMLPPGTTVQGTVQALQDFGIFVDLPGGIVGLIPMSQLAPGEDKGAHKRFGVGSTVEATVLGVDTDRRRITLTRRPDAVEQGAEEFARWRRATGTAQKSLGTLGDLLAKRKTS